MPDSVVKLDSELKKRIENYISKDDNRFNYPSVKNFVDVAILNMLKELKSNGKSSKKMKKKIIKYRANRRNLELEK
jgi:hypothetical protein